MKNIKDILKKTLGTTGINVQRMDKFSGLPSGFPSLDRVTGGFEKADLVVIASRPSMGKTAFTLCLARNWAMKFNIPTLFISLEMNDAQLSNRFVCMVSKIDILKLKAGNLDDDETQRLKEGVGKIKNILEPFIDLRL